jgi:beta-aspartyl-dipeptidase (metallo-type)
MFILLKNADIYEPSYTGRKDVLICNERIIKVADTIDPP